MTANAWSLRASTSETSSGSRARRSNRQSWSPSGGACVATSSMYVVRQPAQRRSRLTSSPLRVRSSPGRPYFGRARSRSRGDVAVDVVGDARDELVERDVALHAVAPPRVHAHGAVGDVVVTDHEHVGHL